MVATYKVGLGVVMLIKLMREHFENRNYFNGFICSYMLGLITPKEFINLLQRYNVIQGYSFNYVSKDLK